MDVHDRGALTVQQFARWSGVCRTKVYELIGAGDLHSFKIGARQLIRMSDAQRWLDHVAGG